MLVVCTFDLGHGQEVVDQELPIVPAYSLSFVKTLISHKVELLSLLIQNFSISTQHISESFFFQT